jgi:hypothetical protein
MSDNTYFFCYWDDLGDSQNHVDNQEKSDNKTNNANTGTENGMGILHEQIKAQEDRFSTARSRHIICELRQHDECPYRGEAQGARYPESNCQI